MGTGFMEAVLSTSPRLSGQTRRVCGSVQPFFSRLGYVFLVSLTLYIPVEPVLFRYLPLSGKTYLLGQFWWEAGLYALVGFFLLGKFLRGRLPRTSLDPMVVLFLFIAVASLTLNRSPIIGALINVRKLVRFVLVYYLVVYARLSPGQVRRITRVLILVGVIQVGVGLAQVCSRGVINPWLQPRSGGIELFGFTREFTLVERGREIGSTFGTMGDTVPYAEFLLVLLAVLLTRGKVRRKLWWMWITIGLVLVCIAVSYVRAAYLAAVAIIWVIYGARKGWVPISLLAVLLLIPAVLLLLLLRPARYVNPRFEETGIWNSLAGVFTSDYIERAQKNRLSSLLEVAPTVLINRPWLGYGPDEETAVERLVRSRTHFLSKQWTRKGFKDVYWVALLVFYGVPGLMVMLWLFGHLFWRAYWIYRSSGWMLTRQIALAQMALVVATALLLFFNRALEFRGFAFYFWLLPGLVHSLWFWERREMRGAD